LAGNLSLIVARARTQRTPPQLRCHRCPSIHPPDPLKLANYRVDVIRNLNKRYPKPKDRCREGSQETDRCNNLVDEVH
jgi:hypothetical protein